MLLSDLSVKRPVFATVINLVLVIFGIVCFSMLPLREFPDIDSPVVTISTDYPGASAEIVESKITQPIEDMISGVEGIKNVSSNSRVGRSNVTIEFNINRDIDAAANDVPVSGSLESWITFPTKLEHQKCLKPIVTMTLSRGFC